MSKCKYKPGQGRHPMKDHVCCMCGIPYVSNGPNSERCPKCSLLHKRVMNYASHYGMNWHDKSTYAAILARLKKIDQKPKRNKLAEPVRCHYCGKHTVNPSGYCNTCTNSGLHYVHRVTGRTNGWDRAGMSEWRDRQLHQIEIEERKSAAGHRAAATTNAKKRAGRFSRILGTESASAVNPFAPARV